MKRLPQFTSTPGGVTVESASPTLLSELLTELESELTRHGVLFRQSVKTGLSPTTIAHYLEAVGLNVPEEAVVWFEWRDGPSDNRALGVLPSLSPVGVESATRRYRDLRADVELEPSSDLSDFGIGPGWLPLGRAYVGLAVSCEEPGQTPRPIRYANEEFPYEQTAYRALSICTYATWMIFGLRSGAYVWHSDSQSWNVDIARLHPSQIESRFW
jgi:hypothetical protein